MFLYSTRRASSRARDVEHVSKGERRRGGRRGLAIDRVHFVPIIFFASLPRDTRDTREQIAITIVNYGAPENTRERKRTLHFYALRGSGLACDDGNNGKAPCATCIRAAWTIKGHDL